MKPAAKARDSKSIPPPPQRPPPPPPPPPAAEAAAPEKQQQQQHKDEAKNTFAGAATAASASAALADKTGSSGRGNGMRSMATNVQEGPGTSIPCHNEIVPSKIERSSLANFSTNGPTESPLR